jgi:hypothetical protein
MCRHPRRCTCACNVYIDLCLLPFTRQLGRMLYHGRDSCWGLELGTPALGRLVLGRLVLGIVLGETRRWETLGGHLFGNQRLLCTRLGGWRFQWCVPSIFAFTTQSFGRCLAFHCIHGSYRAQYPCLRRSLAFPSGLLARLVPVCIVATRTLGICTQQLNFSRRLAVAMSSRVPRASTKSTPCPWRPCRRAARNIGALVHTAASGSLAHPHAWRAGRSHRAPFETIHTVRFCAPRLPFCHFSELQAL